MVLEALMEEKMYDELRNKEQLGYYVDCAMKRTAGVNGFCFIIQSAEYSPVQLEERISKFVKEFFEKGLTEAVFDEFKKGLIGRKKAGFKD